MGSFFDTAMQSAVLKNLPEEDIKTIMQKSVIRNLERGASICIQGEAAHSLFVVLEGWVKTYRVTPSGNEAVIGVFTESGCFGEEAALRDQPYFAGAEAVSDGLVLQIDGTYFAKAIESNLSVCKAALLGSMDQNRALVQHVEQLKSHTGAQRIADFLLSLCKSETGSCTVILPYDKVLMAAWLGMKPESLSRAFRRLIPYGVHIQKNHAVIESIERLSDYADEDPAESWNAQSRSETS
ncbi:Crp/Fnr family transcriptional regulator [Roseovarius phycicola]|uniref:Crp/Fnr family transcriptional regulator n=1 Tax=Roseovarius phycicola TaxID=3080976 RepID=A0ABZ2HDC4_9RHOB